MICKSCGKKYKYKETGNMGDDMKKSGWASMINHDMVLLYQIHVY